MLDYKTATSLDTVSSYLPALVLRRFALTPHLPTEPISEHFLAAVLFADISGFTALTEKLAEEGAAGTEKLTQIINGYFSQMISVIHAHGGDVVKFAGDALVAVWQTDKILNSSLTEDLSNFNLSQEDLTIVTHRAAQCSLAIQDSLKGYAVSSDITLSLHVSLGAGEVVALHLGGIFGRWELLITGHPLVQVGLADKQAKPNEVLTSPQAWELLQTRSQSEPRKQGFVRLLKVKPLPLRPLVLPALPPAAESVAWSCIPRAVLNRLRSGQSQWLAELRCLTVLFINLPDLNENTPASLAQKAMQTLQKSLYHYEGSINKLNVDDKGTTLIAALGLPPLSHEDDALRGVQAALTIQRRLAEFNWQCAIGVSTGRVFCGAVGSLTRREYTMLGDTVNLAARLMQASPGKILTEAATYRSTLNDIRYERLPELTVKGKAEPLPIYRPYGLKTLIAPHRHTTLIGRVQESQDLANHLQRLQVGESNVIIIEGEAGIGKTRLVAELIHQTQIGHVHYYLGAGDAIEKTTPYYAWRPVVIQLLQLDNLSNDEVTEEQRTHCSPFPTPHYSLSTIHHSLGQIDDSLIPSAPLLSIILPVELSEHQVTSQLTEDLSQYRLRELMAKLLQITTPCVLILEDAQWLDAASWELLNYLRQAVRPLLLVLANRPLTAPLPDCYQQLYYSQSTHIINLESLSLDDTITLVCQRLGVRHLPDPVIKLLEDKAQGHPLFSEELAYALRDSGLLQIRQGECNLSHHQELPSFTFPETVQGMIASRIDRLTPEQQLTLKVASVIGRVFSFALLQDVYPIESQKHSLLSHVESLKELDLTPLDSPPPDLAYRFKHAIIQEVTYNLMLFAQRRELHRRIAEWYEQTYQADLSPVYPLLAHHWSQAEVSHKALEYAEKAGKQASYKHANREAVQFFNQALSLSHNGQSHLIDKYRQAQWERELGEAYIELGQLTKSRLHLQQALALLGCPLPTSRWRLLGKLAKHCLYHWLAVLDTPCTIQHPESFLEAASAYERMAQLSYYNQDLLTLFYTSLNSLTFAQAAKINPGALARGYTNFSIALLLSSLTRPLATRYHQTAHRWLPPLDSISNQTWVYQLWGLYHFTLGHLDQAQSHLQQAAEMAQQVGDKRRWEECLSQLALLTHYQGQFQTSLTQSIELYALAKPRGDIQAQQWGLCGQALNQLRLGEIAAAQHSVAQAQRLAVEEPILAEDLWQQGLLAVIQWRQHNVTAALEAAQLAVRAITHSTPINNRCLEGYAGVAEVYLRLWEQAESTASRRTYARLARSACAQLRRYAKVFVIARPRAWLWQGLLEWLAGNPRRAFRSWQQSLHYAQQLNLPYEQGLVYYEMGCHSLPPDQHQYWQLAQSKFQLLGVVYP